MSTNTSSPPKGACSGEALASAGNRLLVNLVSYLCLILSCGLFRQTITPTMMAKASIITHKAPKGHRKFHAAMTSPASPNRIKIHPPTKAVQPTLLSSLALLLRSLNPSSRSVAPMPSIAIHGANCCIHWFIHMFITSFMANIAQDFKLHQENVWADLQVCPQERRNNHG